MWRRYAAALVGLAEAGCRWIEVHEPGATGIGADADARARFMDAHATLTAGFGDDVHLSLAITGGSADAAGIDTVLAGAYASLALDLIDGPDNWRLATAWPAERGLICGALSTREGSDDGPELLLWAARYAASTRGRGPARVGLATAGSSPRCRGRWRRRRCDGWARRLGWRRPPSMNGSRPSIRARSTSGARRSSIRAGTSGPGARCPGSPEGA